MHTMDLINSCKINAIHFLHYGNIKIYIHAANAAPAENEKVDDPVRPPLCQRWQSVEFSVIICIYTVIPTEKIIERS